MAQESPSRDLDKVIVRLPDGMRDRLKAAAEANKRSMNAEIIARLDRSFMSGIARRSEEMADDSRAILRQLTTLEAELARAREEDKRLREELMGWIKRALHLKPKAPPDSTSD